MIKVCILGQKPDGTPDFNRRYWLAGDPCKTQAEHSGVEAEQRGINRDVQREGGAGWPFKKAIDRAGETLDLQFRTSRKFASAVAAWRWRNSLSSQDPDTWPHPIEGDCLMRFELPDGTHEEARLYDCVVRKPTMTAEGETLQLAYTLQGGRIEAYASDLVTVIPFAGLYFDDSIQMAFYASGVGGAVDNAAAVYSGSFARAFVAGDRFTLSIGDNLGTNVLKNFECVNPGDSAGGGRIPVTVPLTSNLTQIVDAFAADTQVRALVVTTGARPYVYLGWRDAPIGDPTEAHIVLNIGDFLGNTLYEAGSTAASFSPTGQLVIPTDANGVIPTAAIPNPS